MIYRTLGELAEALVEAVKDMPQDGSADAWVRENAQVQRLTKLGRVYLDAKNNPPDGVIGVGAITYAEKKLVDFQQN